MVNMRKRIEVKVKGNEKKSCSVLFVILINKIWVD